MLTRLTPDSSYATTLLPTQILLGLGLALIMMPCFNVATLGLPPRDIGVVAAVVNTSQQIGASVGTALLNTLATTTAAADYLMAHPQSPTRTVAATVHGYTVASGWATGVLLVAAVLAGLLVDTDLRPRPVPPAVTEERRSATRV